MYLAWLLNEQSHGKAHLDAMTQIAKDNFQNKNEIITSVITLTEVLASKLSADQEDKFFRTFKSTNHTLYDVDYAIAKKARELRQTYLAAGKKLSTPDSLHISTAIIYQADEMNTFDDGQKDKKMLGLLGLSGQTEVDGLVICKPSVITANDLFSVAPATGGGYVKPPLSASERMLYDVILKLVGGVGNPKKPELLNAEQRAAIQPLVTKGYVALTKTVFMVVLPAD